MSIPNENSFPSIGQLVGKIVVVFGGSSGIGYHVAKGSLEHGAKVVIASSNAEKVEAAVKSLSERHEGFKGSISGYACDARDEADLEKFWDKVGRFDHLVYTAADIRHMGLFEPTAAQRGRFDINFWGALISAKYITTKGYINRGGSITMTIGSSFSKPMKGWVMAAAVTGAIDGLTRGLAVELAPIRVNTISPGYVDTDIWLGMDPGVKAALEDSVAKTSLVQHVAKPEEIADAYLFCMKCTNLTGITMDVEGGRLLAQPLPDLRST